MNKYGMSKEEHLKEKSKKNIEMIET